MLIDFILGGLFGNSDERECMSSASVGTRDGAKLCVGPRAEHMFVGVIDGLSAPSIS